MIINSCGGFLILQHVLAENDCQNGTSKKDDNFNKNGLSSMIITSFPLDIFIEVKISK